MSSCSVCKQTILHQPPRCWRCKRPFSIDEEPAWVHEKGVCTPIHASCVEFKPAVEDQASLL